MRLTLKVKAYCDQPPPDPQVRSFDTFPVILGRSTSCDYSLNDVSRYISSNHAVVSLEAGQLQIQDTSANGVYLNGASEPVGRGRSQPLQQGDTLAIGDYIVTVSVEAQTSNPSASDPFDDFAAASPSQPDADAAHDYDPFRGDEPDWTPPSKEADDPFGDDWDMNEIPSRPARSATTNAEGEWADWETDAPPENPAPAKAADRKAVDKQPDPFALDDDEFDWLPGTSNPTVSIPPSLPDRQPVSPQPPKPVKRSNRAAAQAHQPHDQHPLEGLLNAASLRESDFNSQDETELLEQTGRLLAQMVDAMMVLLQSRAQFKNAMRSDVTTLTRSDNNPLKFSYSSGDALTRMLTNDSDGYMQADAAIQEAVDDLKLHQVAMLEGMKAAVSSLLSQFDPGKLAKKLEKTGGLSANIPITREAKLWDMFCDQYDAIREEAVSDFGEMFGAEFRKAYEKRIKLMGRKPEF